MQLKYIWVQEFEPKGSVWLDNEAVDLRNTCIVGEEDADVADIT